MSHLVLLCSEIEFVVFSRFDYNRDALDDLHAEIAETVNLLRIVSQQAERLCAEVAQDLRADVVFAQVLVEAESEVSLDRVHALILKSVCAELVD